MKNLLLFFLTVFSSLFLTNSFAQKESSEQNGESEEIHKNCYEQYSEVFEKRGAEAVKDGEHDKVIITIRKGPIADCYYGKAKVRNGKVTEVLRMFRDGTYEPLQKKYKHEDESFTINNGMSKTKVTKEDELITVLFVNHIKPKKKEYMKAPPPDFD